jgi:hypothetical protein
MKKPAPPEIFDLVNDVKSKHHLPRLHSASIAVAFDDGKPFNKGRFNWGKVSKFGPGFQIWMADSYDFELTLCDIAFNDILETALQKEAYIDLLLNCCQVEYVPEMTKEGKPAKDKWGRIIFTEEIKYDDDGNPRWKKVPLDIPAYQDNVARYGCWCEEFIDLKNAIKTCDEREKFVAAF